MKALHRHLLVTAGALVALVAAGSQAELEAQRTIRADPNAPRMMVGTFRGNERGLGTQAATAIESRLRQDIAYKELWVISRADVVGVLEASGFHPDSALDPTNAKQLATLLRADEYVAGRVDKTGGKYAIDARLVLSRDNALVQPLPRVEASRMDQAALLLSREVQAARKQLAGEKKCVQHIRENKNDSAVTAAKAGIAAYERSTLARLCLATAYQQMKAPPESILAVTNAVLAIDPRSRYALQLAADAHKALGQEQQAVQAYTSLLAAAPNDPNLVRGVVEQLAGMGNLDLAKPIVDTAVAENPGDMGLVRLQWLIYLTAKDWKGAARIGESMVQTDTASADTLFFRNLAIAYLNDSQPQKAAEAAARGVAKFPNDPSLMLFQATLLRQAGQLPQALEVVRRIERVDPKADRLWVQKATIFNEMNQPDSALVALQAGVTHGEDSTIVSQIALQQGNVLYRKSNESKSRDDYQAALKWLQFSDQVAKSPQAALLIGVTSFNLGQSAANEASKAKSCELAQLADQSFNNAMIFLPRGAQVQQEAAAQMLNAINQFQPFVADQIKRHCR